MTDSSELGMRRLAIAARTASTLFAATSIVTAITVGAMQVGDWGAGILDNRVEWVFWAGAVLGGVGVLLLGLANLVGARAPEVEARRIARLTSVGLPLFLVAPVLCVVAYFVDYWI